MSGIEQFTFPPKADTTKILLDGAITTITKDTITPANTVAMPVEIVGASGTPINITAGDINVQLTDVGANYDATRIGDGTNRLGITASAEAKVYAAQLPATIGVKLKAASLSVTLASDSDPLPITSTTLALESTLQSAVTNLSQINTSTDEIEFLLAKGQHTKATSLSVTIASDQDAIPITSATLATEATLTTLATQATLLSVESYSDSMNTKLFSLDNKILAGQQTMASSVGVVIASNQSAVPVSGTFWQTTQPVSGPLTDAELRAAAVPVSGTFWQATQPVSGPLTDTQLRATAVPVSGAFWQTTQPVSLVSVPSPVGRAKVAQLFNDHSVTPITTAAYVQLVASTTGVVNMIEVFDSSGEALILAVGAAASEVDQLYIFPGGNGKIELAIPASSRISVKAKTATTSSGFLAVNLYS